MIRCQQSLHQSPHHLARTQSNTVVTIGESHFRKTALKPATLCKFNWRIKTVILVKRISQERILAKGNHRPPNARKYKRANNSAPKRPKNARCRLEDYSDHSAGEVHPPQKRLERAGDKFKHLRPRTTLLGFHAATSPARINAAGVSQPHSKQSKLVYSQFKPTA